MVKFTRLKMDSIGCRKITEKKSKKGCRQTYCKRNDHIDDMNWNHLKWGKEKYYSKKKKIKFEYQRDELWGPESYWAQMFHPFWEKSAISEKNSRAPGMQEVQKCTSSFCSFCLVLPICTNRSGWKCIVDIKLVINASCQRGGEIHLV